MADGEARKALRDERGDASVPSRPRTKAAIGSPPDRRDERYYGDYVVAGSSAQFCFAAQSASFVGRTPLSADVFAMSAS